MDELYPMTTRIEVAAAAVLSAAGHSIIADSALANSATLGAGPSPWTARTGVCRAPVLI